jgi:hypothetical protein
MQKPFKSKALYPFVPPLADSDDGHNIGKLVEAILDVLRRHQAEPNDGVLSLLTALIQAANKVMEASTPEETEHNRAALLAMLDHGRRFVEGWPQQTPAGWSVH